MSSVGKDNKKVMTDKSMLRKVKKSLPVSLLNSPYTSKSKHMKEDSS
jgi:hypothetical protein